MVLDNGLVHLLGPDDVLNHSFILDCVPVHLLVPEWEHGLAHSLVQDHSLTLACLFVQHRFLALEQVLAFLLVPDNVLANVVGLIVLDCVLACVLDWVPSQYVVLEQGCLVGGGGPRI